MCRNDSSQTQALSMFTKNLMGEGPNLPNQNISLQEQNLLTLRLQAYWKIEAELAPA